MREDGKVIFRDSDGKKYVVSRKDYNEYVQYINDKSEILTLKQFIDKTHREIVEK